jgi:hypothetical protein
MESWAPQVWFQVWKDVSPAGGFMFTHRAQIILAAARNNVPAVLPPGAPLMRLRTRQAR